MSSAPHLEKGRDRRFLLRAAGGVLMTGASALASLAAADSSASLPNSVAGVAIPDTPLAVAAAKMSRAASAPFLFNHCMRTYLFGALRAKHNGVDFDHEAIFVAAALHDLGLTSAYAGKEQPFEMDGADAARRFLIERGVTEARAELVWKAIAMHTSPLVGHEPPQVALVGEGAGADVFGGGLRSLPAEGIKDVLTAFPRLGFKLAFEQLLIGYCQEKPLAQAGGWTDAFCRAHTHGVAFPDIGRALADSPFTE